MFISINHNQSLCEAQSCVTETASLNKPNQLENGSSALNKTRTLDKYSITWNILNIVTCNTDMNLDTTDKEAPQTHGIITARVVEARHRLLLEMQLVSLRSLKAGHVIYLQHYLEDSR
jgi:hypothetical protein